MAIRHYKTTARARFSTGSDVPFGKIFPIFRKLKREFLRSFKSILKTRTDSLLPNWRIFQAAVGKTARHREFSLLRPSAREIIARHIRKVTGQSNRLIYRYSREKSHRCLHRRHRRPDAHARRVSPGKDGAVSARRAATGGGGDIHLTSSPVDVRAGYPPLIYGGHARRPPPHVHRPALLFFLPPSDHLAAREYRFRKLRSRSLLLFAQH